MDINFNMVKYIENQPEKSIIIARELYEKKCLYMMTETAFLKRLERLTRDGMVVRISKGIYCKPKKTRFGILTSGENEITEYFLGKNNKYGFETGYKLYNKYKLTTQISKKKEVYSVKSHVVNGLVKNVNVKKLNSFYKTSMLPMIELLEILENYNEIEDLNQKCFKLYCERVIKEFDENSFEQIYKNLSYKKRTIAFLVKLLEFYSINNNLKKHLKQTSKYKIPEWEQIYEST